MTIFLANDSNFDRNPLRGYNYGLEGLQMDVFPLNWDSVPEVMNKEQFFRICHISKSTALHLLKSGKVPSSGRVRKPGAIKSEKRM